MKDFEYIIEVKKGEIWCLHTLARGTSNEKIANEVLEHQRAIHPDFELRLGKVKTEDCWWRNGCD